MKQTASRTIFRILSIVLILTLVLPMMTNPALADYRKGDIVTFGSYEQDSHTSNGAEPIEWYVVYANDTKALLVSRYCLFSQPFNDTWGELKWDSCTLRDYLNDDFYYEAFSSSERSAILSTTLLAEDNSEYHTDGGEDTTDKVFILSADEAKKYLNTEKLLKGVPTKSAIEEGARRTGSGTCWYFLRTPGSTHTRAAYVSTETKIVMAGVLMTYADCGVRPAIWVSNR